jgi:hypothetical protein
MRKVALAPVMTVNTLSWALPSLPFWAPVWGHVFMWAYLLLAQSHLSLLSCLTVNPNAQDLAVTSDGCLHCTGTERTLSFRLHTALRLVECRCDSLWDAGGAATLSSTYSHRNPAEGKQEGICTCVLLSTAHSWCSGKPWSLFDLLFRVGIAAVYTGDVF